MVDMATIVSLCKQRGFIFQGSEIYGGIGSAWDYGPLGVELKNNLKKLWWKSMTSRLDIVGLDSAILMHPRVWEASGHVEGFQDPLVDCKSCKHRFKADQVSGKKCPDCGGDLTDLRMFNLMFKTHVGPVEDSASLVYLRPETAQGIYVNFENVYTSMRKKVPFGIAQIGKAFRNEITPGNFIFRTREFEQMEMQYFVKPSEADKWFDKWKEIRFNWYKDEIGLGESRLRFHQHDAKELAHYAKVAFDIQYEFPIGWQEIEGIHHRSDYDLRRHQEYSNKSLEYFDEATKEKFIPYVIETSEGCDRTMLAIMIDAYHEEEVKGETRVVLRLNKSLAPIKIAVLPLSKKDDLIAVCKKVVESLQHRYVVEFNISGSIGKRYRRQDEIGTPYCVTVDFESLSDQKATVRDRDSMKQDRVELSQLKNYFLERF
ncbi:MAG: glycine--tRNA ligase [Deltaproteobacteria bacterium RIFCSPHIGHO2_12_FULL_43_9]|nr:MAG: glycine--tRNA ligase [Deltaproteobacteria bacterium RIFCSPHIGHO2_12_FULL_43_9]